MAERSKALDSSSSIFGCVGSNPTPSMCCFIFRMWQYAIWARAISLVIGTRAIGLVVWLAKRHLRCPTHNAVKSDIFPNHLFYFGHPSPILPCPMQSQYSESNLKPTTFTFECRAALLTVPRHSLWNLLSDPVFWPRKMLWETFSYAVLRY